MSTTLRWVKASERLPEIIGNRKLSIKYKGFPDLLVSIDGKWYWFEKSIVDSREFPVYNESWSAIEWLEELPEKKDEPPVTDKTVMP